MINIGSLIQHRAMLSPNKEGLVDDRRMTFRELNQEVNRAAHAFRAMGIQAGQRIALLCKNHRSFVTAFFGAAKCGIITIPINWRLHPQEIQYILEDSGASILIYDAAFSDKVQQLQPISTVQRYIPVGNSESGDPSFDALISSCPTDEPELETTGDDCILIMYTSGTTGKPKGAMITHTNLLFASIGITHVIDWWERDRFLSVAPFFHIGGFVPLITNIHTGATSILMADFDPIRGWKTVEQERITTMMTVPAMLTAMHQVFDQAAADIFSLRNITCGASAVPKTLIEAFAQRGISVQQVYGITEYTGAVSFWKKEMDPTKSDFMGKTVFHGEVKIIDVNTKKELPAGQVGEIVCRGPQVFTGYWQRPQETAETVEDGWLHTGDLGMVDQDGFLYVVDRLKDMIISGGENIYSTELEMVLLQHPGVAEVAVIGVPDERWGEIPRAYVVPRSGWSITAEELIQHCRERLASYKCIKEVVFLEQLPRNAVGKILKVQLKQEAAKHSASNA